MCGKKQREQAADWRHGDVDEDEQRPLAGVEHRVEDDEDEDERDGQHEHEAAGGALLALVLAGPVDLVAGGQLDLRVRPCGWPLRRWSRGRGRARCT